MRFRFIFVLCMLCASSIVEAQSFSVFDLDPSGFPTIKAKFYAFDADGNRQDPSTSEITVTENEIPRTVTSITCPPTQPPQALSSVLVMDVSGSMSDGSGGNRNIDLAKAAATYWVDHVPLGTDECSITSFDDASYLNQDFTTNRTKLDRAIAGLAPQNGTNYDAGLLLPVAGGLQITTLAKHKRVIVFLTDGLPNFTPQTNAIIAEAQRQGCLIFSVTVGLPCPQCLKDISVQTGGMWFENVTTGAQIEEVYREILSRSVGGHPCEISWASAISCSHSPTTLLVSFQDLSASIRYVPPESSVERVQIAPAVLFLRSKPVGKRFDTNVTVTSVNTALVINDITSSNSLYTISPRKLQLAQGESKNVTISFTPTDSNYSWAEFDIATERCNSYYFVSGGYPGRPPSTIDLKLTKPNGGEQYVAGSDTDITWKGIPLSDPVRLGFTADDGNSWSAITDTAVGGAYGWTVPRSPSNRCRVRVTQPQSPGDRGWLRTAGGSNFYDDWAGNIAIDLQGNVYHSGIFSDTLLLGDTILAREYGQTAFIVKYRQDGKLDWAKCFDGIGLVHDCALGTDHFGNLYVTGEYDSTVDFGGQTLSSSGLTDFFLAKYDPYGTLLWVRGGGGVGYDGCWHVDVGPDGDSYCSGYFTGTANFDGQILTSAYGELFVMKYDENGALQWARQSYGGTRINSSRYINSSTLDNDGNLVVCATFKDTINLDGIELIRNGTLGILLAKFGPDGHVIWARTAHDSASVAGDAVITIDDSGSVILTGVYYDSTLTIDTVSVHSKSTGQKMYLAKYDSGGRIQWLKQAFSPTNGVSFGSGVAVDPFGRIYLTGGFTRTLVFGSDTVSVTSLGTSAASTYLAQYDRGGNELSVRQFGNRDSNSFSYAEGIKLDPFGNVVTNGRFYGGVNFGGDTETTPKSKHTIYVYLLKLSLSSLQSDTSDAVFSIVMPQDASQDVDMGNVFVSGDKDSVVQTFVRNVGSYPFRVDSIVIVGADASQFGLVSGIPPYTVGANSAQRVEFRFTPTSAGPKQAQILVFTQADTLRQTIQGIGVLPELSVASTVIDFGTIDIGTTKDTTVSVALQNNGNQPITFANESQLGPDKTQFSILSGGGTFTLAPSEIHSVTLRFAPHYIGRTSGRIAFNYGGPSPAVLTVYGQGLGGSIVIDNDSGYAGDHRGVPVRLENAPVSSLQSVATSFRARVSYDASILYPSANAIVHGARFDTVTITGALGADSILTTIPFIAMLGRATESPMNIVDFQWLDSQGNPADYDAETESGTFKLLGLCPAGGSRLFDPTGDVQIAQVSPNPTSGVISVTINTIETGRTQLRVMNLLGASVATLFDGEPKSGAHTFQLNTSAIAAGSYYLTLLTPTVERLQRIDIVR